MDKRQLFGEEIGRASGWYLSLLSNLVELYLDFEAQASFDNTFERESGYEFSVLFRLDLGLFNEAWLGWTWAILVTSRGPASEKSSSLWAQPSPSRSYVHRLCASPFKTKVPFLKLFMASLSLLVLVIIRPTRRSNFSTLDLFFPVKKLGDEFMILSISVKKLQELLVWYLRCWALKLDPLSEFSFSFSWIN